MPDLGRALPLLIDQVDLLRGPAAAAAMVARQVDAAGPDPRRRALMLALASDNIYGIRGQQRSAATEAIACAEAAGPRAAHTLHRALINLVIAKVTAGEGLDAGLLNQAENLEETVPFATLHDTAELNRGLWSRFVEDLDMSLAALRRSVALARDSSDDWSLVTFLSYLAETLVLAGDFETAAAALEEARQTSAWHDWPTSPWHVKPHCELLIAAGDLDEALDLADELNPDDDTQSPAARFLGATVRGKIGAWRGYPARAIRDFELAGWCADQCEWFDPGVRKGIDSWLAEAYVGGGRPEHAGPIAARLQRVADQIATGATSQEAAAALFISVRTVETHVASIYRKLGVRTRSELGRTLTARSRQELSMPTHPLRALAKGAAGAGRPARACRGAAG